MTCARCGESIVSMQPYACVRYGDKTIVVHDLPCCLSSDDVILSMSVQGDL